MIIPGKVNGVFSCKTRSWSLLQPCMSGSLCQEPERKSCLWFTDVLNSNTLLKAAISLFKNTFKLEKEEFSSWSTSTTESARWKLKHIKLLLCNKSERRNSVQHNHDMLTASQAFVDAIFETEQEGFFRNKTIYSQLLSSNMLNNSRSDSGRMGLRHNLCNPTRGGIFAKPWKLSLVLIERLSHDAGVSNDFHIIKTQFMEKYILETQVRKRPISHGEPAAAQVGFTSGFGHLLVLPWMGLAMENRPQHSAP